MKLVIGITAPSSVTLIKGQASYFVSLGYTVYLLAPDDERVKLYCKDENCIHLPVPIERKISLIKDLIALFIIYKHLRKVRPNILNVGTPKISLLALLASIFISIPKRIYTCRGFRFEHEKGFKKALLINMERLTSLCSNKIICISNSLKSMGVDLGIFPSRKVSVLHYGSSNGIDLSVFNPGSILLSEKNKLKNELNLENTFVFGFVGRLNDRKGINELYNSFVSLFEQYPYIRLVMVGSFDLLSITDKSIINKINMHPAIRYVGPQKDVPIFLSLMDVFVLPTWCEGFGNVFIQAAAMGVSIISFDTTGAKDAVNNGYNGILVPLFNEDLLKEAMKSLLLDENKRKQLGQNGLKWVENFRQEHIWNAIHELYKN